MECSRQEYWSELPCPTPGHLPNPGIEPAGLGFILLFQEGGPFQGLKLGSCLALGNELSEETHVLTKQEILLGRGTGWRAGG